MFGCGLSGLRGVGDDAFEFADVLDEAGAAVVGQAAKRLRTIVAGPFPDFDEAGFLQDFEMPTEVSIGEVAELFEFVEEQTVGVRDERRDDSQAGLLVDDPFESIVGKAAGLAGG